jgi:formamidopyrimidine-DNA glycosylase
MLTRAGARNNVVVPELPDLRILAEAFTTALVGRPLQRTVVHQPLVLRGTNAELLSFEGRVLEAVAQRGKFLILTFGSRRRIVVNAMLTGRLGLAVPGSKAFGSTAVVFTFGPRTAAPAAHRLTAWTRGAAWLPPATEVVELRYRDPRRMGKVYVLPEAVERDVAGWDALGPDADDPALDLATWQARIRRHDGELHNLLKNQAFVAGIGNAYSDEVLWLARLGPFRKRASLAEEESERLWRASRETMAWAIAELRTRVPPRFEEQARDFLHVHLKGGQPCPRCGATLSEVSPGGFVTTWCRACQA